MPELVTISEVTAALVETGSIIFSDQGMIVSSGLRTPIYFNVGDVVISFPQQKEVIVEALAQTYRQTLITSDRLVGVPEGMNILSGALADIKELGIGQLRVREEKSSHGQQRSIEGNFKPGQTVAIFEDVITLGGSTLTRAILPLINESLNPNLVVTLIDRQRGGVNKLKNTIGIPTFAFATTTEIAEELIRTSALNDHQLRLLRQELKEIQSQ